MNMASAQETGTPDASVDSQHPWLGLASFTEETRQYFYGRDEEVGELSRRVQRKLLTILFGQSGLGKTSILSAGIVPRLRPEGFCPVYVRIDYSAEAIPPGEQIKQAIFRATEAQGSWTQTGVAVQGESLWEFLHHRDDELVDAAGKPIIPLLIFDQFEEIFTLAQADDGGRKRAAGFLEELADLVENRPPKALEDRIDADDRIAEGFDFARADYRILIALREDYLAHLEGVKGIMPSITQNRMRLARMNGQQALAAVMKPGGKLVTQEVAESIVRFVAGGSELPNAEVEPSLLSLICRELNNTRIAQGKAEISVDLLAGSKETILAEFYERALADQPAAVRKVIEDDLLTDSGYRENLAEERVLKAFAAANAKPDAATTLATLVNRRLLRIEERLDIRRVELTHDVLTGVVKASREERMEREAREEAERKLAEQKEREAATRKALVRARQIAAGCAVLAIMAVGSGIWAYRSQQEAVKTRQVAEISRGEAERLLEFLLDDFLNEMGPMGRSDIVAGLAKRTVDYYENLPPEARSPVALRNSAAAKTVHAAALNTLGKTDEALKLVDEAAATIKKLRMSGDQSDELAVADANQAVARGWILIRRADLPAVQAASNAALESLKPVLQKPDLPVKVRNTELQAHALLSAVLSRLDRNKEAVDAYQKTRELAAALGAREVTNLPAATTYLASGAPMGHNLIQIGKLEEAKASAEQDLVLADRVLAARPSHRQVLAAKSNLLSVLSRIEGELLRMQARVPYRLQDLRIQEELARLEAGNSVSQQGLRNANFALGIAYYWQGRMKEAEPYYQRAFQVGKDERISGGAAMSMTRFHGAYAGIQAGFGDAVDADTHLAEAERYLTIMKSAGAGDKELTQSRSLFIRHKSGVDLRLRRNLEKARAAVLQRIPIEVALVKGDKGRIREEGMVAELESAAAEISMAMGDFAAAEIHFRQYLDASKPDRELTLDQQWWVNENRAMLAYALAKQGKLEEADKVLEPARAFYRLPLAKQSDDKSMNTSRARILLAEALIHPAQRMKFLADAKEMYERTPASMKSTTAFSTVGDDIAREMKK